MRREPTFALASLLCAGIAAAQQSAAPTISPVSNTPPTAIAYYAGQGITAPELIPFTVTDLSTSPCKELDGVATLTAVVDTQGVPVEIRFLRSIGNGLDKLATHLVSLDRFKPGTRNGAPAAVVISDEILLQTCVEHSKDEAGEKITVLHLRSLPEQKIYPRQPPGNKVAVTFIDSPSPNSAESAPGDFKTESGVTPPVVIHSVPAEFSDYARQNHVEGVCLVTLVVDTRGMPQDLRISRSLEPTLDRNALEAISQYRFKPGTKNGVPVPIRITVEVDFRM